MVAGPSLPFVLATAVLAYSGCPDDTSTTELPPPPADSGLRDRQYGTLTAHGRGCGLRRSWFDDHAPSLELFDIGRLPAGGRTGAEDYLHAALLALNGLPGRALVNDSDTPCGRYLCHRAAIDFRAFDREPPKRDEDGWTLRPLLRSLAVRVVEMRVGRRGYVEGLRVAVPGLSKRSPGPVRVELSLAGVGEERRVPYARAHSYE
jgi:hypothetical protein